MSSKSYDFRATGAQRLPLAWSSGARCMPFDCFLRDHCLPLRSSAHTHRAVSPPSCAPVAWALSAPGAPPRAPGGIRRSRRGGPVCFYAPPLCVYKRFSGCEGGGGFLPNSHRPKKRFIPRRPLRPVPGRIRHRDRQGVAVFPGTTPSIGSFLRRQNRGHRSPSLWSPPRSGTRAA